ncbi:MAG: hypothetical protein AAGK66_05560 [Pseudomonadota bacterium]
MSSPDENTDISQNKFLFRLSIIQMIPAVVGIFIAIVALFAALNESDAVRKQQQAAVWPHLQVDRSNTSTDQNVGLSLTVRNRGIGPARVRAASVSLDGEMLMSWDDLFSRLNPISERSYPRTDSRVGSSVLVPSDDVVVISLNTDVYAQYDLASLNDVATREDTETLILSLRSAFSEDRVTMELCYCSVFDDCWHVSNIDRDPKPVQNCSGYSNENNF